MLQELNDETTIKIVDPLYKIRLIIWLLRFSAVKVKIPPVSVANKLLEHRGIYSPPAASYPGFLGFFGGRRSARGYGKGEKNEKRRFAFHVEPFHDPLRLDDRRNIKKRLGTKQAFQAFR